MPCQGGMTYREITVESGEVIDALTQKLCYLCASLYADGLLEKYASPAIVEWHRKHMHEDEVRISAEMQSLFRKYPARMAYTAGVAEEFLQAAQNVHPVSEYHQKWFKQMAKDVAEAIRTAQLQGNETRKAKARGMAKLSDAEKIALGIMEKAND